MARPGSWCRSSRAETPGARPADPAAFAAAIAERVNQLLASPSLARQFGSAGRQRALAEFTWEAVAKKTAEVYSEASKRVACSGGASWLCLPGARRNVSRRRHPPNDPFQPRHQDVQRSVTALRDVTVDIPRGEFVFIVGPSGSGKTTFLRLVTKEERADGGDIWVAGKEVGSLAPWKVPYLRRNIGCIFQDYRLLPDRTVYQNVAFALEVIGRSRHFVRSQVPQILELVGLGNKMDRRPTSSPVASNRGWRWPEPSSTGR